MKVTEYTLAGKKGTHTVKDVVFAVPMNKHLFAQAVRMYTTNSHQSTSWTQTRSEVSRTKRKWYKQKGTGNARHGARSAPIFVGGGTAHGPKAQKAGNLSLNQHQKQLALKIALSAQSTIITVVPELESMDHKTAVMAKLIASIQVKPTDQVIVVTSDSALPVAKAVRNLPTVSYISAIELNALDVASVHQLVFSPEAIAALEARLAGDKNKKTAAKVKKTPTEKAVKRTTKAVSKAATTDSKKTTKATATKQAAPANTKTAAAKETVKKTTAKTTTKATTKKTPTKKPAAKKAAAKKTK